MREQVALAQRVAIARVSGVRWETLAQQEAVSARTLRYHLARWQRDLLREQEPTQDLLDTCQLQARGHAEQLLAKARRLAG